MTPSQLLSGRTPSDFVSLTARPAWYRFGRGRATHMRCLRRASASEIAQAEREGGGSLAWPGWRHPTPGSGRRDALRELASELRDVFHRRPNSAPLLATRSLVNIETMRCYEAYLGILQRADFDRHHASTPSAR